MDKKYGQSMADFTCYHMGLPEATLGEAKNFLFGVESGERRFSTNGRMGLPGSFAGLALADTGIAAYLVLQNNFSITKKIYNLSFYPGGAS
jgi:hypothetical protein